jgi:hypothetical protein
MNYVYPIKSSHDDTIGFNSNLFKDVKEIDLATLEQQRSTPFDVSLALKESLR